MVTCSDLHGSRDAKILSQVICPPSSLMKYGMVPPIHESLGSLFNNRSSEASDKTSPLRMRGWFVLWSKAWYDLD